MSDNGLEDLVTNGREDTLIVVEAEILASVSTAVCFRRADSAGNMERLSRVARQDAPGRSWAAA